MKPDIVLYRSGGDAIGDETKSLISLDSKPAGSSVQVSGFVTKLTALPEPMFPLISAHSQKTRRPAVGIKDTKHSPN